MFQSSLTDTPPEPCAQLFDPSSNSAVSQAQTPPVAESLGLKQRRPLDEAAVWNALAKATSAGIGAAEGGHSEGGASRAERGVSRRMRKAKKIDVASRILFPLIFAVFNLSYWSHYLYQAAMERDKWI